MSESDIKCPAVASTYHARPTSVWATGIGVPISAKDSDARLRSDDRDSKKDQVYGQYGWDAGLEFATIQHLAAQIGLGQFQLPSHVCGNSFFGCGPVEENQITRLAIVAHGAPGAIDINNSDKKSTGLDPDSGYAAMDLDMLNILTIPAYAASFMMIERVLAPCAQVFFMSCCAAQDVAGRNFFLSLSRMWSKKKVCVVGYSTILYTAPGGPDSQKKPGAGSWPGVRETHSSSGAKDNRPISNPKKIYQYYEERKAWMDLSVLPWASAETPHALVACDGVIIKYAKRPVDKWDSTSVLVDDR